MNRKSDRLTRTIYFAGDCFWGLENSLQDLPRIVSTECGYANGGPHYIPDYMLVCYGGFWYREAICVDYDPSVIDLDTVLTAFFFLIDPTQECR